ncbi:hypothetical protein N1851_000540 [Merluccius polli]|uniref:Uncharacterized protein n=1 Tax=Merluccius polli TaxID=89951 RepID=A0AA47PBS3_MERPO|nr:hypothetical protein N1851_000540 [Merluccius polli]
MAASDKLIRPAPASLKAAIWQHFGFYEVDGKMDKTYASTMDEETEEGGPPSKTYKTLSGEHGRHSRAKSPEQKERADSPGLSCVSMKSDRSMEVPEHFKDGRPSREER